MKSYLHADDGYTESEVDVVQAERKRIQRDPKVGLALSGGGIRSASFSLGVLQALVRYGVLKDVDYLSTVSGGGYIGSALTWWLARNLPKFPDDGLRDNIRTGTTVENFPFGVGRPEDSGIGRQSRQAQNAILDFLRFHSSYLVPGNGLDLLSIVAIAARNILLSLTFHLSGLALLLLGIM
ncbi:MAG: hypothetical protein F4X40_02735 [Chloroflexi bacterium]|nr:hypothetical protein [Chloroflexota bacterium]